jgi:hypothetical protein
MIQKGVRRSFASPRLFVKSLLSPPFAVSVSESNAEKRGFRAAKFFLQKYAGIQHFLLQFRPRGFTLIANNKNTPPGV